MTFNLIPIISHSMESYLFYILQDCCNMLSLCNAVDDQTVNRSSCKRKLTSWESRISWMKTTGSAHCFIYQYYTNAKLLGANSIKYWKLLMKIANIQTSKLRYWIKQMCVICRFVDRRFRQILQQQTKLSFILSLVVAGYFH